MARLNKREYSSRQTVITADNLNEIQDCILALQDNTGAYATTLILTMDSSTYVLTLKLKNESGDELASATVDLPLESTVVSGSYDSTNKKLILTLQSGNTVEVPLSDLISGLVADTRTVNGKRLNANIVLYASDIALSSTDNTKVSAALSSLGNGKIDRDGENVFVIGTDSNGIYYEEVET